MFRNYIEARIYFQENKDKLKVEELKSLLPGVNDLHNEYDYLSDKILVADLIVDIEHQIDLMSKPEILVAMRRKEHDPTAPQLPSDKDLSMATRKETRVGRGVRITDLKDSEMISLDIELDKSNNDLMSVLESKLIKAVMKYNHNNKAASARMLGSTVKTLYTKITRYKLVY